MTTIIPVLYALFSIFAVVLFVAVVIERISELSAGRFTHLEVLCWSFLLAPTVISYLLWMGMMLFPGKISSCAYLACIPLVSVVALVLFRARLRLFMGRLTCETRRICEQSGMSRGAPRRFLAFGLLLICGAAIWACFVESYKFDMSEYLLGGDYFAWARGIAYDGAVVDPRNGFWYHTYHSYCLPLFATWGCFIRDALGGKADWYYRFIVLYYLIGLNFVMLAHFCRLRLDGARKVVALYAFAVLNGMPFIFCEVPLEFNCDPVRCSFLLAIVLLLWRHLAVPQWNSCLVLGLLGSAAVAVHGTSVVFAGLLCLSLLFAHTSLRHRFLHIWVIASIVFLTWGLHYFLQSVFGDGWLFPVLSSELSSKSTDPWIAERFSSFTSLIFNGYLGWLFNVQHFGVYVVFLVVGVAAWSMRGEKLRICHLALLTFAAVALVMTTVVFYYNFRYQYTFVPLMVVGAFTAISRYGTGSGRLCCILTAGYLLVSAVLTAWLLLGLGNHFAGATAEVCGGAAASRIVRLMRSRDGSIPWPAIRNPAIEVGFCGANEMPYRDAPYPVWYLCKDMVLRGAGCSRTLSRRQFADKFCYFLLEEGMRGRVECGLFDSSLWAEEKRLGEWTLYRSLSFSDYNKQGGLHAGQ